MSQSKGRPDMSTLKNVRASEGWNCTEQREWSWYWGVRVEDIRGFFFRREAARARDSSYAWVIET